MFDALAATTVAEQQPQSFLEFLSAFWGSWEMQLVIAFAIIGVAGQSASYLWKWFRDEITGNLLKYLFIDNFKKTGLTYIGYMVLMITAVFTNSFTGSEGGFVGWRTVVWFGLVNAFALDVAFNKGQTSIWTPAKRKAERAKAKRQKEEVEAKKGKPSMLKSIFHKERS